MPGLTLGDADSPVRVVVIPSQSSYFAGEPFSVRITFTNTRSPEAGPSKPTAHSHRRGAHSISSAPLARPPTSPGPPRSAINPSIRSKDIDEIPRKKGFIGKTKPPSLPQGAEQLPDLIEQRRKRQLAPKALSVSISPYELEDQLAVVSSAPHSQRAFFHDTRNTPTIPSPLTRTDSLSLSSNHPHARKQSVLDGQFSLDVLSPTTSIPPSPYTPNASTSTFSLALDPIAEAAMSPYPSTPAIGSPTIEPVSFPPHTPTATTPSTSLTANAYAPLVNSVYAYPPPRHYANVNHQHPTMQHRPTPIGIGLGQPSNSPRGQLNAGAASPRTAFASTFPQPHNELILYSYAQLTGTVILTPVPGSGALSTVEQTQTLNHVRSALLNRAVLGGGSMDITATLNSAGASGMGGNLSGPTSPRQQSMMRQHRQSHSRSSSFSGALLSILSPTSLVASMTSPNPNPNSGSGSRWRSASAATPTSGRFPGSSSSPSVLGLGLGFGGANGYGNGIGMTVDGSTIDPEDPLPTFEIQPAMLAVDLSLAPGESRSYTYTLKLPENLPPTYKGKSLRFSYELVVGTCRAGPSGSGTSGGVTGGVGVGVGANSISRVMKVPIRVYNNVSVGRTLKPYDILWPVSKRMDAGMPGTEAKVVEDVVSKEAQKGSLTVLQLPSSVSSPLLASSYTLESIRDYARSLLASLPHSGPVNKGSSRPGEPPATNGNGSAEPNGHGLLLRRPSGHRVEELRRIENEREKEKESEGGLTGCREAVEILTRIPKKASYDVNKDGVKVAVLTFTKSAYRLGETVTGVVELNERVGRARVLKVSAILESHESLPSSISPPSSARHLRRSHAESHSSFTLNTLRTTFSLDIPSDASPAFQVRIGTQPNNPPLSASGVSSPIPTPGGLEWKVRLCLLVGVASEHSQRGVQGVQFRSLQRDGPRGEWGSSWTATRVSAPLEKPDLKVEREALRRKQAHQQASSVSSPRTWGQFFVSSILYGGGDENKEREYHDGDALDSDDEYEGGDGDDGGLGRLARGGALGGEYDGIIPNLAGGVGVGVDYEGGEDGWKEVKLETVECEVPLKVFPGNTAFKALDVIFDV